MDATRFDNLTRALARASSRRTLLSGLAGALATGLAGARPTEASAAQRPARQANGGACSHATDCASFSCVDGVCCDTACAGQCESCATGTCSPVAGPPVGNRPACPGSGPCQATCDGVTHTHCAGYPGAEVTCGAATCADGWQTTHSCGGNGACVPITTSCAPFGCDASGTACSSGCASDDECGAGAVCVGGQCVPAQGLGAPCTDGAQCQSGVCANGVCCAEACGPCEVCNAPGSLGFCAAAPDGDSCAGGHCCEGVCVDPLTDVEHCGACGTACLGDPTASAICVAGSCSTTCLPGFKRCAADGPCISVDDCCVAADCPTPEPTVCQGTPFCDGGACNYAPADSATQCRPASCADGRAIGLTYCSGQTYGCPEPSDPISCAPYQCDELGIACRATCDEDDHCQSGVCCGEMCCASGETCNASDQCVRQFTTVRTTTWTVPPGVTAVRFDVYGAQGGSVNLGGPSFGVGGQGGRASGTLSVTNGEQFTITVGGRGGNNIFFDDDGAGGFPNGGTGGAGLSRGGGGGGGSSDVRRGGSDLAHRMLIGGGGGGGMGGNTGGGAGGGESGTNGGTRSSSTSGGGATASGAGVAGTGGGDNGQPGTNDGQGGSGGGGLPFGGGGGGGGRFGGGGGGASFEGGGGGSAGGGGNGYVDPSATEPVLEIGGREGNGLVIVSYPA